MPSVDGEEPWGSMRHLDRPHRKTKSVGEPRAQLYTAVSIQPFIYTALAKCSLLSYLRPEH
jgi:hypothetical protein